jgi:hypothetical protein
MDNISKIEHPGDAMQEWPQMFTVNSNLGVNQGRIKLREGSAMDSVEIPERLEFATDVKARTATSPIPLLVGRFWFTIDSPTVCVGCFPFLAGVVRRGVIPGGEGEKDESEG